MWRGDGLRLSVEPHAFEDVSLSKQTKADPSAITFECTQCRRRQNRAIAPADQMGCSCYLGIAPLMTLELKLGASTITPPTAFSLTPGLSYRETAIHTIRHLKFEETSNSKHDAAEAPVQRHVAAMPAAAGVLGPPRSSFRCWQHCKLE